MAERTIIVCDSCGRPAAETVTIRVGTRNLVKDLCATHIQELTAGARKPRPGRRKGAVAKRATATKQTTRKAAAKRSPTKRRTSTKRRGRPRKAAASAT